VLIATLFDRSWSKGAAEVLQHLTRDPEADGLLLQAAAVHAETGRQAETAARRYEGDALARCWAAAVALSQGHHELAAESYGRALDLVRVRPLARQGLRQALFALAQADAGRARALAGRLLQDHPEAPALLLPYAYACLRSGDVGTPGDSWGEVRNMASALGLWERGALGEGLGRGRGALTRAEFWSAAGRPDRALGELGRALRQAPGDAEAALLGLRLARASLPSGRAGLELLVALGSACQGLDRPEVCADRRDVFEAARRAYPQDPRLCLYLGLAYAGLRDSKRAAEMFDRAIALAGPETPGPLPAAERQEVRAGALRARERLKTPAP
jgi:tetratricopeptide (TPR) repeat protein